MLPEENILNTKKQIYPSKTYKIDFDRGKVVGMTDGAEALEQAVYLILNTERYRYLIYSFYYGVEFENFIGKERDYVKAGLKRCIEEALTQDDRIEGIENFKIISRSDRESLTARFDVVTNEGIVKMEKEVKI